VRSKEAQARNNLENYNEKKDQNIRFMLVRSVAWDTIIIEIKSK
jgi:hypothetical protein